MTDILNFPGRSEKGSRHEFIQEGTETLQFGDGDGTGIVVPASGNTHFFSSYSRSRSRSRYWSNQELADLFRVKRLLDAAGIACEIEHGSTDEEDPWFVFCDEAGDVFIHLCRIDGEYLLDSYSLASPLRGKNFNGLIEAFTQRHVPQDQPGIGTGIGTGAGPRVVRFERNGKVFMHPATMLAALVWTLFLASEKLVMLLPETAEDHAGTVDGLASGPFATSGHADAFSDEISGDGHPGQNAAIDVLPAEFSDHQPAAQFLRELIAHEESKLHYNTYAVGLSAIALAVGFMSSTSIPDIDPLGLSDILAALLGSEETATPDEQHKAFSELDENTTDFLAFIEDVLEKLKLSDAQIRTAENKMEPGGEATNIDSQMFQLHLDHLLEGIEQGQIAAAKVIKENPDAGTPGAETIKIGDGFLEALINGQESQSDTDAVEFVLAGLTLTEGDDDAFLDDLLSITVENREIRATFDVTADILDKTSGLLTSAISDLDLPLTDSQTIGFSTPRNDGRQHYDEDAQAIIQFIMDNAEDLEIIATQDEVMFFDAAIIDADVDDIIVFAWTLDNGDIIAAMGLRSELEDVSLIM